MLKRTLALGLGLAAGVFLLELALRLVGAVRPAPEPPLMRQLPQPGPIISSWSSGSSQSATDSTESPIPRILVVGDSFTVGRGVALDEVYPARLAAELGERGHPAEVVSLSFPGWNTRTEATALARQIDRLDPDLLIIGHCLNDAERQPTGQATSDRPELRPWAPTGSVEIFLAAHSRLFFRIRSALDTLRLRPILRSYYGGLYDDDEGRRLWRRSLKALRRIAADRSIPAVLVVFPIFDSDLDSDYSYRRLHTLVQQTAEELGYLALDLLGVYEGLAGQDLALVPFTDPHPSALAHDIAGREIARYLERGELLRPRPR